MLDANYLIAGFSVNLSIDPKDEHNDRPIRVSVESSFPDEGSSTLLDVIEHAIQSRFRGETKSGAGWITVHDNLWGGQGCTKYPARIEDLEEMLRQLAKDLPERIPSMLLHEKIAKALRVESPVSQAR